MNRSTDLVDAANPPQQGLKLHYEVTVAAEPGVDAANPPQQGLKHRAGKREVGEGPVDAANPPQQGLKPGKILNLDGDCELTQPIHHNKD